MEVEKEDRRILFVLLLLRIILPLVLLLHLREITDVMFLPLDENGADKTSKLIKINSE